MSLVSVIIPARNAATTIGRTLQSLVTDVEAIGEILVMDDGSSDETGAHARHIGQALSLPVAVHRVACGSAAGARNQGLERAGCAYVYFIDADDVLLSGKLVLMVKQMRENEGVQLVIGASTRITPGQKQTYRFPRGYGDDPLQNADMYLRNGPPPIAMGSALVRRDAIGDVRFPESCPIDEDTWFWAALLGRCKMRALQEVVVRYNLDAQRTANRFCVEPQATWHAIERAFERFREIGIAKETLAYRKAWLAQRFARQLIKFGHYREAKALLRPVRAHPELGRETRTLRYRTLSTIGLWRSRLKTRRQVAHAPKRPTRTAVISFEAAYPPVSGGDLRCFQNARLAARNGPVLMASVIEHTPGPNPEGIEVVSLTRVSEPKAKSANSRRLPGEPRISQRALERLPTILAAFDPDTVILEGVMLRAFLPALNSGKYQLILDMHNVESELALSIHLDRYFGWFAKFAAWRLRRTERKVVDKVDKIWTCTEEDRDRVIEIYGVTTPVHVVPNGIPRQPIEQALTFPDARKVSDAPNLLYVGHLGYAPNVQAVQRLAREIFPPIRARYKSAALHLVGRYPKPVVTALAALEGVEIHENPAHIQPFLDRADLSIIPLERGGGSRIKILEAAASGVPVIASEIAAEGLVLTADADVIFANSNEEFIHAALDLLGDSKRRAALRNCAFGSVQRLYTDAALAPFVNGGLGF